MGFCLLESTHVHEPEIDLSETAIKERYDKFGEILRYVLPDRSQTIEQAKRSQAFAVAGINIFVSKADIEKADSNKIYISHHILHYDVQCNGEEDDFQKFTMALASKYTR